MLETRMVLTVQRHAGLYIQCQASVSTVFSSWPAGFNVQCVLHVFPCFINNIMEVWNMHAYLFYIPVSSSEYIVLHGKTISENELKGEELLRSNCTYNCGASLEGWRDITPDCETDTKPEPKTFCIWGIPGQQHHSEPMLKCKISHRSIDILSQRVEVSAL